MYICSNLTSNVSRNVCKYFQYSYLPCILEVFAFSNTILEKKFHQTKQTEKQPRANKTSLRSSFLVLLTSLEQFQPLYFWQQNLFSCCSMNQISKLFQIQSNLQDPNLFYSLCISSDSGYAVALPKSVSTMYGTRFPSTRSGDTGISGATSAARSSAQ